MVHNLVDDAIRILLIGQFIVTLIMDGVGLLVVIDMHKRVMNTIGALTNVKQIKVKRQKTKVRETNGRFSCHIHIFNG